MNGLSFFNPSFLWAFAFLAVPLIIHLLRRRRMVKLDFSSLRFLKNTAVKASRMRWLKNLLLLLNRLLIIALLVVLFAQPYKKSDPFRIISGSNTALYCWIDPTISMGYQLKGASLWQEACSKASVFDTLLHTAAVFYCYDGRINDFIAIQNERASEVLIERVTPLRHGPTDFEDMLTQFNKRRKEDTRTPVLIVMSDFQAKDSSMFKELFSVSENSFPVLCVSLAVSHPWNYALDKTRIVFENTPVLKCRIKSYGRELSSGEVVAFVQNMRAGQEMVHVDSDDSATAAIILSNPGTPGGGEARLLVDDPYSYDNSRYFVKHHSGIKRILIISEGEEAFPIEAAVRYSAIASGSPSLVKRPLEVTFDDLDSSDIIVLSSVHEPTNVLATLWGKGAFSQKLILFAPSVDDKSGSLNELVYQFLGTPSVSKKMSVESKLFPVLPDTASSLWRGFPRFTDKDVAVYTWYTPLPGNVLLRLNNGMPLVSLCSDSSGCSWVVFATPIGISEANNLCETGFYMPFLDRIIHYGHESLKKPPDTWIAGNAVSNPYSGSRISAHVFNRDKKQIAFWDRQSQVTLETPGLYKIQPQGEPVYWIAAVSDSSEGDCVFHQPTVADFNKEKVKFLNRSDFSHFIQHHKTPGFDFLWVILALCLFTEVLLWRKKWN